MPKPTTTKGRATTKAAKTRTVAAIPAATKSQGANGLAPPPARKKAAAKPVIAANPKPVTVKPVATKPVTETVASAPAAQAAPPPSPTPEAPPAAAKTAVPLPPAPEPLVNSTWMPSDPADYARNLAKLMEGSGKAWTTIVQRAAPSPKLPEMTESAKAFGVVTQSWLAEPEKLLEAQKALATRYYELWQSTLKRGVGHTVAPVVTPEPGDNRFKDPDWKAHPYFDTWKQYYLITSQWLDGLVDDAPGIDDRTKQRADFYLRQITTAASPSNHPLTNPEVIRATLESSGGNLVKGMENFQRDLERSGAMLSVAQSDTEAFEVGRNVATTPGKVVFQNSVIQLLQYTPTTKTVHRVPLLIVPPWINKFYILDLQPQKSFIKYAVDQGFTVFVVSWVNPDGALASKTFEDYAREGILAAADAVSRATDVHKINVLGYCVGGTLLATTLAWLAAANEDRFRSATFLAAQVDFEKAGDLLVFIDDNQLNKLEATMAEAGGVLDGGRMAQVFNMMRPRDLIWPYVDNNYMLGKKPMAFDLLYWNQDSTRMCAANHIFYLRNFYLENKLAKGGMSFGGRTLDMAAVKLPVYELAAKEDHIAPAESVYRGARLFGGPVRYVMAGSGHIAGVINPPGKPKYQYWSAGEALPPSLAEWQAKAAETAGSWWPDWSAWLAGHAGEQVNARPPGEGLAVLEDAPGSYVRVKA